jgi:multiple sugar transport system substrate-binding protein
MQGTAAAAAVTLGGVEGLSPAHGQGVNWKKFAGQKLEVFFAKGPRGDILQKYEKEFEALTGIKVQSEQSPEIQQRQKSVIEFTSGKPSFDVVHVSYHVSKRQYDKAGWLGSVGAFMKDPSLTEPSLTESDFSQAGLLYSKTAKGDMTSLPLSVDYWMIYWNKELFAKKGIEFPKTFDELIVAAEKLTDPKEGIYGFAGRGLKNANLPVYTSFLLGFGVDPVDAKGNLMTDSPEGIEAAKIYQRLLTKSAPPGIAGFNWYECQAAFLQGKVGMWIDGLGFAPPGEDPAKSKIVGKIGYGLMPKGPKAQASATFGDGIAFPAASTKKEAAYLYCQWAVAKKQGANLLQSGSGVPFRNSILNDPEVQKGVKMPKDWLNCVIESAKISRLGLPVVIPVTEFRDIIGVGLTNTLTGGDVATEMKKASDQYRPILEKSEKS